MGASIFLLFIYTKRELKHTDCLVLDVSFNFILDGEVENKFVECLNENQCFMIEKFFVSM